MLIPAKAGTRIQSINYSLYGEMYGKLLYIQKYPVTIILGQ